MKEKIRSYIKKLPFFSLLIIFTLLLLFSFFYRINIYYDIKTYIKIICFIVALLLFIVFFKLNSILKNVDDKKLIIVLYSVIIILEIISMYFLRIKLDAGDLSMLYGTANRVVNGGVKLLDNTRIHYFENFPHQMFSLFFFEIVIKIANLFKLDYLNLFTIINAVFIFSTIIFLDLIVKEKFGQKYRKHMLLLCVMFVPIYLFVPIFYTDTLSMCFGFGAYYFYLLLKKSDNKKNKCIFIFLISLLLAIGANFKITIFIVFIAILIEIFCEENNLGVIIKKSSIIIVTSLCMFKLISFVSLTLNPLKVTKDKALPYSHWIMMGLDYDDVSYGGYYKLDFEITESQKTVEDMRKENIRVIKERLNEMGFFGYINFLTHKLEVTWMDGGFVAPFKYNVYGLKNSNRIIYNIVNPNGKNFLLFVSVLQTIHYLINILFIYSLIYKIKKRKFNNYIFLYIIIGTLIFFALWETRSRYILNNYMFMFLSIVELFKLKKEDML